MMHLEKKTCRTSFWFWSTWAGFGMPKMICLNHLIPETDFFCDSSQNVTVANSCQLSNPKKPGQATPPDTPTHEKYQRIMNIIMRMHCLC
jgi:hypothetical protein